MGILRRVSLSRRGVALLFAALVLIVGFATGTFQRINRAPATQATRTATQAASDSPRSDSQVAAYSEGYRCVKTTHAAFAKAHLTSGVTTMAGAHRMTARIVVGCDRGAAEDRAENIAWYRMGAGDAMRDMFGETSGRVACLTNFGCGATHATIRYFETIQQGAQP